MSINKEGLEFLQQVMAMQGFTQVPLNELQEGNTPFAVLPDQMHLESLERFMPRPVRFRQKYTTEFMEPFCKYVETMIQSGEEYLCFIAPDDMRAKIVFDMGSPQSPGVGEHSASLSLKRTPEFRALLSAADKPMKQREFAEWLEDWRGFLKAIGPEEGPDNATSFIDIRQVIQSVRNFNVKANTDLGHTAEHHAQSKSALHRVEVENRKELPAIIRFTCNPYTELEASEINLRLSVTNMDESPKFTLRIINEDLLMYSIGEEFSAELRGNIHNSVTVLVGSI